MGVSVFKNLTGGRCSLPAPKAHPSSSPPAPSSPRPGHETNLTPPTAAATTQDGLESAPSKPPPRTWALRVPFKTVVTTRRSMHLAKAGPRVHMKKEKQAGIDFERIFEAAHIKRQVGEAIHLAFQDLAHARVGYHLQGLHQGGRRSRGSHAHQPSAGRRVSFSSDLRSALRVGKKRSLGRDTTSSATATAGAGAGAGAVLAGRRHDGGVPLPPILPSFHEFCESPMMAVLVRQVCIYCCGFLQAQVANLDFILRPRLDTQLSRIGDTYAQLLMANYGRPELDDRAFFECVYHVTVTVVHEMLGHVVHLRQGYHRIVDVELGRLFRGPFACSSFSQDPQASVADYEHEQKQRRAVSALGYSYVRPYPIYRHGPPFTLLASSIKDKPRQKAFDLMTVNNEKLVTFAQQHIMRAFRVRLLVVKRWKKTSQDDRRLPEVAEDGESARTKAADSTAKKGERAAAAADVTPSPPPPEGRPRPKFNRAGRTLTNAQAHSPMVEFYLRASQVGSSPEEEMRQAQEVVVGSVGTSSAHDKRGGDGGREVAPSMDGLMAGISRFHRRGATFRGVVS